MDIKKLRLHKMKNGNGLELSIERSGNVGDKVTCLEIHKAIVHNDLYNAVQALAVHLAIMAFHVKDNEVEDIAMPDPARFKDFSCGSYSISGEEEKRGIIISGTLRKGGKAHNFNTPFYRFEEPDSGRYAFMGDLEARLRVIETEVIAYLDGVKSGEAIQPELGEGGAPVTKMQIAHPDEKATAEGNLVTGKTRDLYANKDAMERVAEMPTGKGKGGSKKKVQQTAAAPSGEVEE